MHLLIAKNPDQKVVPNSALPKVNGSLVGAGLGLKDDSVMSVTQATNLSN